MSYYLGRLRAGYSKMRIVAQLRISNEGKAHAANLPGLDAAVKRQERGQQPITGWLFRLFEGTDGERPTERRLRTIENQINILRGESVFGLNQIETLLRGVHHLVAQQAQYTPAATNDLNRSTNENTIIASEILSDFEIHEQLPPRARNIYFKIKRATVNNSRSLT